jgi:transposase
MERDPNAKAREGVRLKRAQRHQLSLDPRSLDERIELDHPARAMWAVAEQLDLQPLYDAIRSRERSAGAPAIDPLITLVLWIHATSEGVSSGREIEELCRRHDAYRWICGGVSVKAHHLTDFRARSGPLFEELIAQVVAVMLKNGLCDLSRVSQDGTRLRASAGAASFRQESSLEELRTAARKHLEEVLAEADDPKLSAIRKRARERGARDRLDRIEAAIQQLPEVAATKRGEGPARVSVTDPDCRVMKRGDGGYRPGYNAQLAVTADKASVIVGVEVTPFATDQDAATPMVEQIEDHHGQRPTELLTDGGYVNHEEIEALKAAGTTLIAPLPKPRKDQRPPTEPRDTDTPAVAEWRARMQTDDAKRVYKLRGQTIERANADGKAHRALDDVPIRGVEKAFSFVALFALTYDILRLIALSKGE